jgi:hypothetical protein
MSGALGGVGVVVSDVMAAHWGRLLPTRGHVIAGLEHARRVMPLGGTTCEGGVHEAGLGMLLLHGVLSLLHRCYF